MSSTSSVAGLLLPSSPAVLFRVLAHRAEFDHLERLAVQSHALLNENTGPGDSNLIATATSNMNGDKTIKPERRAGKIDQRLKTSLQPRKL